MNNRITTILVASLLIGIGVISCISQEVKADDQLPTFGVDFTWSPDPGYYKETMTFEGTASCPDPVTWEWTFQPGSVKKYGNPVTYSWAPYWQSPTPYRVHLKVTNGSGASAGCYKNAPVTIAYDIYGNTYATPLSVPFSGDVTIHVNVWNEALAGNHICPEDYRVTVEIVGIFGENVAWPGNITGPRDLDPGESELDLTTIWTDAHPAGMYRAKVTLDTRFDTDTGDNGPLYSNWFTVRRW